MSKAAKHTHLCPDCGKGFEAEDAKDFLEKNPCRKARARKATAAAGTCLHCHRDNLPESKMAKLSDGGPANCCLDCDSKIQDGHEQWKAQANERAMASVLTESATAAQRTAWKKMNRNERKQAMAGKASGELFK